MPVFLILVNEVLLTFFSLTPPLNPASSQLLAPPLSLPQSEGRSKKRKIEGSGPAPFNAPYTAPRKGSSSAKDDRSLAGLLALLQVVNEIEDDPKSKPILWPANSKSNHNHNLAPTPSPNPAPNHGPSSSPSLGICAEAGNGNGAIAVTDPAAGTGEQRGTHCGNKCCVQVRTEHSNGDGWARRKMGGTYVWLCESCALAYSQKQYCEHCKQIYIDTSQKNAVVDGLAWIQCDTCNRWAHIECESKAGRTDIEVLLHDPSFVYSCIDCSKTSTFGKKNGRKRSGLGCGYRRQSTCVAQRHRKTRVVEEATGDAKAS